MHLILFRFNLINIPLIAYGGDLTIPSFGIRVPFTKQFIRFELPLNVQINSMFLFFLFDFITIRIEEFAGGLVLITIPFIGIIIGNGNNILGSFFYK